MNVSKLVRHWPCIAKVQNSYGLVQNVQASEAGANVTSRPQFCTLASPIKEEYFGLQYLWQKNESKNKELLAQSVNQTGRTTAKYRQNKALPPGKFT